MLLFAIPDSSLKKKNAFRLITVPKPNIFLFQTVMQVGTYSLYKYTYIITAYDSGNTV
jgi:hypothetical protein